MPDSTDTLRPRPDIGGIPKPWRALARAFNAERERWALWLPVCFGAGIGFYFLLPVEPDSWPAPVAAAVAAAAAVALRRRPTMLLMCVAIAVVAVGFARAQLRTAGVAAPVLEKRIGPTRISGRVVEIAPRGAGHRIWLDTLSIDRLPRHATPHLARVSLYGLPDGLRIGDVVAVRAVLRPPPGPAAPGAFDFARRAWFEGLGAVGFAMGRLRVVARGPAGSFSLAVASLRHRLTTRITRALEPPSGAVAAALLTGQRGAIPDPVISAMRDSGLAHLLAISGLHIGLVAGILFFILRLILAAVEPLALRYPVKKWAAAGALAGAFAYLLISGATVPTQRAFLMVAVVLFAVLVDRTAISMRLVAWAAALVLLLAPESLLGASFQLSFAAVIALVAVYEALSGRLGSWHRGQWERRAAVYMGALILTAVVAGTATAPFAIYHFNRLALYGVAANAAAVPLTGFWVMPWGLAALALMPVGLEHLALQPMGWGIDALVAVAREVSSWPGATRVLPAMPLWGLAAVGIGGLWLCLWRGRWRLLGGGAVAAGLMTLLAVRPPDVLIDGSARLMAVRTEGGGLALSSRRTGQFEGGIWLRRAGQRTPSPWDGGSLNCDWLGCLHRSKGHTVALVRHPEALAEDCAVATVVVSAVPVRPWRCRQPLAVIDRYKLWREGAHAVWLEDGRVTIRSVADTQGRRPWSQARTPRGRVNIRGTAR